MCTYLGVMPDVSMAQRVAARYAARSFNFKPVSLDSCRHCGGEGVHLEKSLQVKNLCVRCWGTGTEPKSIAALQAQTDEIAETYRFKREEFEGIKKKHMGRGSRQLGMMGRDLQTLNGVFRDRKERLDHELARIDMGKQLAKVAGAAAR